MSQVQPRMDLLVRRLVLLAGDVYDLLARGDWDGALPVQEEFDETFATLQQHVDRGAVLDRSLADELHQLVALNADNQRLAAELHEGAGRHVTSISSVRTVARAYSPLGANHRQRARYVDGSA